MIKMRKIILLAVIGVMVSCGLKSQNDRNMKTENNSQDFEIKKSDDEWK